MKLGLKLILLLSLLFTRQELMAQFFAGVSFDIRYHSNSEDKSNGEEWSFLINPNIGYHFNPKLEAGCRFGLSFTNQIDTYNSDSWWYNGNLGMMNGGIKEDYELENKDESMEVRHKKIGWNLAPFVRYKLLSFFDERLCIWADAHVYYGMQYPNSSEMVGSNQKIDNPYRYQANYGIQIMPMISYKVTDKYRINLHFGIASLAYAGSTKFYDNSDKTTSTHDVLLFSNKLTGLLKSQFTTGLYGIRIGLGRNF